MISMATKIKAIARGMLSSVRGIIALGGGTTVANALRPSKGHGGDRDAPLQLPTA
jgi:hypothetical protein